MDELHVRGPTEACWAITAALRSELKGLYRVLEKKVAVPTSRGAVTFGYVAGIPILMIRTGIGGKRAVDVCTSVLQRFKTKALISIGYAGSLNPALAVGDIVIAQEVLVTLDGQRRLFYSAPSLLDVARTVPMEHHGPGKIVVGRLITTDRVIVTSKEKRLLGTTCRADAVDMESGFLASLAVQAAIPFIAIRSISDDAIRDIPDYNTLGRLKRDGQYHKLLWYVACRPNELIRMLRMRYWAAHAAGTLTRFLDEFLGHGFGEDTGKSSDLMCSGHLTYLG